MAEMGTRERLLHALSAVVAWAALALQLAVLAGRFAETGQTFGEALWRFVGFFTILTNLFVALVASTAALAPQRWLASAPTRYAALVAILLVGIVYSLLLRHIWSPQGWQAVADHALHDASPLLFLLAWLAAPHGGLGWRSALWAVAFPFAYLVHALGRGAFDGWYALFPRPDPAERAADARQRRPDPVGRGCDRVAGAAHRQVA
ncbi:Pr6Pr family membrane protein [Sphingopyxis sp.]|uniref:Pr6Pr family membrane protein n=1 Tax=Sphingopyxis sp. TaxID=1908224 RepID=UPI001D3D5715|nr:Pr6Pr family membrane protein [Sphingopyxis sp.]MBW8297253.1 Pr6Pr family membrane protein [Sphingopyxis sp.]